MTESYDTVKIAVSPVDLDSAYNNVTSLATSIADSLKSINDQLNGLQLSWFGGSSEEMQAVNQRWQDAGDALFGTKTVVGAINQLLLGIQAAGQNYDAADNWVVTYFGQLATSLLNPAPPDSSPPVSVVNTDPSKPTTFINELF